MVVGGAIGFVISTITGRPLRLPFAAGGAAVGFVITGVIFSNPIPVLIFTGIGLVVGWFIPVIFKNFNRLYSGFETRYASVLDGVIKARPIVMAALAGGILLTAFAFTRIPGGFVPIEDQGYAIGFVEAPDGVSNEKTLAINRQVAEVLRTEEDIASAALFSGASLDGNAPNKGFFFIGMNHWDERPGQDHSVGQSLNVSTRRCMAPLMPVVSLLLSRLPFLATAPAVVSNFSCWTRAVVSIP